MRIRNCLRPLPGLVALGLALPAAARPPFPTYQVGQLPNGAVVTPYDQVITPAGTQVAFGSPVRVDAVALQPGGRTAAALMQSASAPVQVFDLKTGKVLQQFLPAQDQRGSFGGLAYSADGKFLFLSQDDGSVSIARVSPRGLLSEYAHVAMPKGSAGNPYPGGMAVSADGSRLYVALNRANALAVVDLTQSPPAVTAQIPVGNVPNSVVLSGNFAYVSNEGGRVAGPHDFTVPSSGTNIVADPHSAAAITGTVSVVDLTQGQTVGSIPVGLHPTGMTMAGGLLFVANTNSDSVSCIDVRTNRVVRTISVKPFARAPFGSSPNSLAVAGQYMFVTLGTNNAVALVDIDSDDADHPVEGLIPTGAFPGSIALDTARNQLVVGNVKGTGALGPLRQIGDKFGHSGYQDTGTVSLIPLPSWHQLAKQTRRVFANNHWRPNKAFNRRWTNGQNGEASGSDAAPDALPRAIPRRIGEPSTIKHVFLVVKENRTYDQVLGDDSAGNGDPTLVDFGRTVTPNQHALVSRFPLLDNFYDSGRQSADGHQWIVQSIAPDYIERETSDFVRSYPFDGGDSMVYGPTGFLWQDALKHGISTRVYGEYADQQTLTVKAPASWSDYYRNSQIMEGKESGPLTLPIGAVQQSTLIPSLNAILDHNYPGWNLGIPDQYRLDVFLQEFRAYEQNGKLPRLVFVYLPNDHTSGTARNEPTPAAMVADNDLAVGRLVDAISHSRYWKDSAIFIEEDDAQAGVDHVDGHRSTAYVISPYTKQGGYVDHTYYAQVNINRTIEQILGLPPLNQFDLAASPMSTLFTDQPDFAPYSVLPATTPINQLNPGSTTALNTFRRAWSLASDAMFRGKTMPDEQDPNMLNHVIWYATTGFKRPYPGETKMLWPAAFKQSAASDEE